MAIKMFLVVFEADDIEDAESFEELHERTDIVMDTQHIDLDSPISARSIEKAFG